MLEITKMLTVSTAHITEETAKELARECRKEYPLLEVFKKGDYGWFIYIGTCVNIALDEDIAALIRLAVTHECEWLCLDRDGIEVDGLPTYEW